MSNRRGNKKDGKELNIYSLTAARIGRGWS